MITWTLDFSQDYQLMQSHIDDDDEDDDDDRVKSWMLSSAGLQSHIDDDDDDDRVKTFIV